MKLIKLKLFKYTGFDSFHKDTHPYDIFLDYPHNCNWVGMYGTEFGCRSTLQTLELINMYRPKID